MIALPSASPFNAVFARPTFFRPRRVYVPATESFILAAVCLLDLASTLFWVAYRDASEGNPIMAYYLTHGGTHTFILAKLVLLVMPLLIAEWARLSRPRFVQTALRVGIAAYLGLYGVGVLHINSDQSETVPTEFGATFGSSRRATRLTFRSASDLPLRSGWNPSACQINATNEHYAANTLLRNEE